MREQLESAKRVRDENAKRFREESAKRQRDQILTNLKSARQNSAVPSDYAVTPAQNKQPL
jgi:hypothetical protein